MYARLDDRFFSNPKVRAAGPEGSLLYLSGLCHCAAHLTDGFIRDDMLPVVAAEAMVSPSLSERLVEVHLWSPADGGWDVHDYLETNQSKSQVEAKRRADRDRQARKRSAPDPDGGSRRDTEPESPDTPREVQSSPVLDGKPSSSSALPVDSVHGVAVDDVLDIVADKRLAANQALGKIRTSPAKWRERCRENLPAEQGGRVVELLEAFDIDARTCADIVEGARSTMHLNRRDPLAASGGRRSGDGVAS